MKFTMISSKNLIIFFVGILCSCKEPKVPAIILPEKVISGEVSIDVKEDIILPKVDFKPNLDALQFPGDTAPIRMVAYGGALPAGYRNGGLYREGQLTSVPQLIAHQMQLASFVSPLFSPKQGNGSGYLLYDRDAPLPSWKQVSNDLGIVSRAPNIFTPYAGPPIDNISWPHGPGSSSDSSRAYYYYPNERDYYSYLYRFYLKKGAYGESPYEYLVDSSSQKVNLVLQFDDLDQYLGMALYSKDLLTNISRMLHEGYFAIKRNFIMDNLARGRKMVLFNYPDFLDFPFFHLYSAKTLRTKGITKGVTFAEDFILIPNDKIKEAFSSNNPEMITLEDQDILSRQEIRGLRITIHDILNRRTILWFSDVFNIPVVDLNGLYLQILGRKYYTDDGLFIDPSFPDGNFFSEDGIYPTAIGSAVIANETIREINRFYHTKIPLINVTEFSKSL